MSRITSLAYLTSHRLTPAEAMRVAAQAGYQQVGLRLWPNMQGAPQQHLLGDQAAIRETLNAQRDTGIGVFDLEIIRIDEAFDAHRWEALYEIGALLKAKAVLVAGDDRDETRLSDHYAQLCEAMKPYGLTADLEFMPWTAVADARQALRIIERAGQPDNAGILVDALHVGRSDTSIEDLKAIPRHLLHYAQICDAEAGTHFTTEDMIHTARCARLLPGDGTIDLKAIWDALPQDLPVSVEVVNFEQEAHYTPLDWATLCLKRSKAFSGNSVAH
jgi:sugar phosphate isomerase/epimerase